MKIMNFLSVPMVFLTFLLFSCNSDDLTDSNGPTTPIVEEIDLREQFDFKIAFPIEREGSFKIIHRRIGFAGSEESNTFYTAMNKDASGQDSEPRLGTINLSNGDQDHFYLSGLRSGGYRIEIFDSKVHVMDGAQFDIYDLDLNRIGGSEGWVGRGFWNFESAAENGSIYTIGTMVDLENSTSSNEIWEWNASKEDFTFVRTMPDSRENMGCELVNGIIYFIGGISNSIDGSALNSILKYNIAKDEFEDPDYLPFSLKSSTSVKYKHLIFVAGINYGSTFDWFKNYFGVYNTIDESFSEIDLTLESNTLDFRWIVNMEVLHDQLYITGNTGKEYPEAEVVDLIK